jgi:hypothetical protein
MTRFFQIIYFLAFVVTSFSTNSLLSMCVVSDDFPRIFVFIIQHCFFCSSVVVVVVVDFSSQAAVGSLAGPGRVVVTTAPDDTTNPPQMQAWVAARIPGAQLLPQAVRVFPFSSVLSQKGQRGDGRLMLQRCSGLQ